MIAIRITEEAWRALVGSLSNGHKAVPKLSHELGGVKHWLDRKTYAMLIGARLPGEDESATILRILAIGRQAESGRK